MTVCGAAARASSSCLRHFGGGAFFWFGILLGALQAVCRRYRERYNDFEYRPFFSFLRGDRYDDRKAQKAAAHGRHPRYGKGDAPFAVHARVSRVRPRGDERYLKAGGFIVYSTCSILNMENEDNLKYFLDKNENIKLIRAKLKGNADFIKLLSFKDNCEIGRAHV